MTKAKRITFYAQPRDQANLARIQAAKPHWPVNFILREALADLANTFPKLPKTDEYPPIQETTRLIKE